MSINTKGANILIPLAVLLNISIVFFENNRFGNYAIATGLLLYLLSFLKIKNLRSNIFYICMMLIIFIFGWISIQHTKNGNIIGYINSIISHGGLALAMLNYKLDIKGIKLLNIIPIGYFIFNVLIGTSPNDVLFFSRNYVSIILLLFVGLIYIAENQNKKEDSNWFYIIVGFLLSVWALGRSGILAFGLLILCTLMLAVLKSKNTKARIRSFVLIIIVVLLAVFILIPKSQILFSRFYGMSTAQEPRIEIINQYLYYARNSISNLLFGTKEKITVFGKFYENLHNSFLVIHQKYGLVVFSMIIAGIYLTIKSLIKDKNYLFISFIGVFILRSFTDSIFLNFFSDFYIYYFMFYSFFEK